MHLAGSNHTLGQERDPGQAKIIRQHYETIS